MDARMKFLIAVLAASDVKENYLLRPIYDGSGYDLYLPTPELGGSGVYLFFPKDFVVDGIEFVEEEKGNTCQ